MRLSSASECHGRFYAGEPGKDQSQRQQLLADIWYLVRERKYPLGAVVKYHYLDDEGSMAM
jgi:hypothetical protein